MEKNNYRKLAWVMTLNTVLMFFITYALIAEWAHFYPNINRAYMALMMAAPMGIMMLLVMKDMYTDQVLNRVLFIFFILLLAGAFILARTQTPVGDEQFLRSMIPHHSSAILMCQEANISDPEIAALCEDIVAAQESEIAQMKSILNRY